MRDYAKLAPTFWTGQTGRALRRRGFETVIVAVYLVSSPHSNMLGLYYQPMMYMAHETGLGIEGASKGLAGCIECSFCSYDEDSEMVFVHEMAAWQIAETLSSGDKRCIGIQKDYEALADCPFLEAWFDRYAKAFHLRRRRSNPSVEPRIKEGAYEAPSQAPPKPHRSQEQEQEQEHSEAEASAAVAAPASPLSAKERLWALGVPLLGDDSRGLLGRLAKEYGDEVLADVLARATIERPIEPKSWVIAACETAPKRRRPTNGAPHDAPTTQDLLERDPRPQWVVQAGFPDIWQAESAGCGPGNFRKFRDGERVQQ